MPEDILHLVVSFCMESDMVSLAVTNREFSSLVRSIFLTRKYVSVRGDASIVTRLELLSHLPLSKALECMIVAGQYCLGMDISSECVPDVPLFLMPLFHNMTRLTLSHTDLDMRIEIAPIQKLEMLSICGGQFIHWNHETQSRNLAKMCHGIKTMRLGGWGTCLHVMTCFGWNDCYPNLRELHCYFSERGLWKFQHWRKDSVKVFLLTDVAIQGDWKDSFPEIDGIIWTGAKNCDLHVCHLLR